MWLILLLLGPRLWILGGFHGVISIYVGTSGLEESNDTTIIVIGHVKVF